MAFTNFIPEVWSARLLEHLDNVHVYSALLNRDYEGDIRAYGDTVHINQIGDIAINDYTGEDLAAPEELDSTMMELRIDQAKYFNFQVKDIDNAQSNPKVVDAAMQRASYNINDVIDNYLAGLLLAGVKSESTITALVPRPAAEGRALCGQRHRLQSGHFAGRLGRRRRRFPHPSEQQCARERGQLLRHRRHQCRRFLR